MRLLGDPDVDIIDNCADSNFIDGHVHPLGPTPQVYRRRVKPSMMTLCGLKRWAITSGKARVVPRRYSLSSSRRRSRALRNVLHYGDFLDCKRTLHLFTECRHIEGPQESLSSRGGLERSSMPHLIIVQRHLVEQGGDFWCGISSILVEPSYGLGRSTWPSSVSM